MPTKTPRLTPIRDSEGKLLGYEHGGRGIPGSATLGFSFSPGQIVGLLQAMASGPATASEMCELPMVNLSRYNPHDAEAIRRQLAEWEAEGIIEMSKNKSGNFAGQWILSEDGRDKLRAFK
jgi:hypothetical protein